MPPTEDIAKGCEANAISDFLMLPELIASFGDLGYDVVEMVLADQEGWDRYEVAKWLTMRRWLEANHGDDRSGENHASDGTDPISVLDHRGVHLVRRSKRTLLVFDNVEVPEVRDGEEKGRHGKSVAT